MHMNSAVYRPDNTDCAAYTMLEACIHLLKRQTLLWSLLEAQKLVNTPALQLQTPLSVLRLQPS
jgi:hypothetical protein